MVINRHIESSTLEGEIENDLNFSPNNHFLNLGFETSK
jgi:hypothetical protein